MMNTIKFGAKFRGEYRYRLTGPDGEIKDQCDWKPNMLLDNGLDLIRTTGITSHMAIGSSNAAAAVGQTYLQGSYMGVHNYIPTVFNPGNAVTPNWEKWKIKEATFGTGVGTGTIGEFILGAEYNMTTPGTASIRVALDSPIVKGALDQLTIQHKFTLWPELGDVNQVININAEPYDVLMRHYNGYNNGNSNDHIDFSSGYTVWSNGTIPPDMSVNGNNPGGLLASGYTSAIKTYGDDGPGLFWTNHEVVWDIDKFNGETDLIYIGIDADLPPIAAAFSRQSDGAGIDKPNTHQLTLNFRLYSLRYTP